MHDHNNPRSKNKPADDEASTFKREAERHLVSRRESLAAIAGLGTLALGIGACADADPSVLENNEDAADPSSSGALSSGEAEWPALSQQTPGVCTLTPEQEEGPYFVRAAQIRKNIIDGKPGLPLKLRLTLVDPKKSCAPIANAAIDVWSADALGKYSTAATGMFLRGVQLTGADGVAEFETIFPGWYPGRTNHIHVKVHVGGRVSGQQYTGGHVSHTGNVFFPEQTSVQVARLAPYRNNFARRVTLTSDMVYRRQNGSTVIMTVEPVDTSNPELGYVASIVLGVDAAATPAPIGIRSRP